MRRAITALVTTALAAAGVVATAAPSDAAVDRRPCVVRSEYQQVRHGMTPHQVARIFDTGGRVYFSWDEYGIDRQYRMCQRDPYLGTLYVAVQFWHKRGAMRVDGKQWRTISMLD